MFGGPPIYLPSYPAYPQGQAFMPPVAQAPRPPVAARPPAGTLTVRGVRPEDPSPSRPAAPLAYAPVTMPSPERLGVVSASPSRAPVSGVTMPSPEQLGIGSSSPR